MRWAIEKHQGGDPSILHEPSTLSVLKNYFFFFAAGFLAAFFAGFFFAATVTHLPSGVEGPRDDQNLITAGTYEWLFHR